MHLYKTKANWPYCPVYHFQVGAVFQILELLSRT